MKGKIKKVVSLLLSIAMIFTSVNILPSTVEAAVNSSSGSSSWSLVWNDEFNQTVGEAPDASTWSYDIGHGDNGWGNQELQRYTNSTDNVRIVDMSSDSGSTDGKALAITAKRQNGEITSGRIKTLNKQYMKYGRVEARLRLDDGMRSGVWPAFWMMGNDIESGASWPYCGEIDIMEHRNAEKQIISTLHWNTGTGTSANYAHVYAGSETTNQFGNIDSINDWHNYAVEWYEDVMKFYLDGVCFETLNINSSEMEEFQKEHFILLNLAIGSTKSPFTLGQTVSDDFTSATMYVDYVRVYQGNDSAFSIAKSGTSETKPTPTTTGDGKVEETTTAQETTPASVDSSWKVIDGGDANTWYYDKNSMSGISSVVNIQKPEFAKEKGIYITVPKSISSVSVNGNTEGVAAIQDAGTVVYLSALTKQTNTVTIHYAGGTGTVIIKNTNGTSDDTTTETQTESQTPTETINAADPYADAKTVLTAPTNAYLYNFTQDGNGYKLSFTKADNSSVLGEKTGTEKYALYVNDKLIKEINATELTVNASNNTATVSLAEGDVSKNGLTKGQQQKVSVREIYSVSDSENYYSPKSATTTFMYGNVESPYADDVPQIFISSSRLADGSGKKNDNVDLLTDTSKTKVNAAIVVKDEKGNNTSYSNIGNIKVRGNSTALTEKKPYNISFNEATDLFGMGKAKKWSLLANAFDKSLIRNKLAMDFQRTLESTYTPNNVYTSNCKFVDLYVDGTFLGNYLLIESVETGSSRVAINDGYVDDTDNAKTESEPAKVTINGTEYSVYDALLELANDVTETGSRYDEGTYYFKTNGCSEIFSINAPERSNTSYGYKESDTNKPEWVTNINTYLNGFETVLNQTATTDEEQKAQFDLISQFIDVDSFVNFYITEEYFMCKDVNFSSTRFYTKGGKLYAGPLWDLDLSSGNIVDHNGYEDYYAQHFAWFNKLMTNKYFKEKVIKRFTDAQPIIKKIYAENGTMDTEINSAKKSIDRNYLAKSEGGAGWELNRRYTGDNYSNNVNKMYTEYASYISDLRTWLQGRNTWLSATTQWNVTDDEYTWIAIPNSNYYYFAPEENQYSVTNTNVASEKILLAYGAQGFNATKVTVDGTEISSDNYESTGSVEFKIKESVLAKNGHPYKVAVYTENSGDTPYFTVYLKKTAPEDYVPKGFAATVDNSGLLTASWTTTSDANAAAATYEVKVGTEIAKVTGSTATYKLSTYGKYKVTLTTRIGSEIKDTQTLELTYSDPDAVGGTLTVSENWEAERAESLVWTEVKNATGYGIYVDGKLYKTTNATKEKIPAYVFAEKSENTNKLSKPTTVGNHTTTVLALFDDEKAPELLTDGKSKNIVDEPYDTTLYVNYIFGTGTNLWNKSISDNVWNFTVCEAIDKKGVTKGALADVEYNNDGSASVKFNDMGENTQTDSNGNRQQPWNVKGALYNIPTENNKEVTVSFDIIGPACLAEKKSGYPGEPEGEEKTQGITINFTPEEIVNGAYGATYKYAKYYFEPATVNGKQVSVLHYSENVKTTNTSYDLLFGLGDLVFSGDDKTLTLTNPVTSTVYGVDTVDAKGLYTSDGKGAAYVGFTSTVPNRQEPYYTYKVSVLDGETTLEEQVVDNPSHITLKNGETGYVPGKEYTVKVESIYAITNEVTATKTATVTIPNEAEKKADLVISSVINKRTNSTTVADSVFRTGESVDVKVTVSNIGSVTSETTKLGLYNADLENTPLLDEKDVPAIEPGQSVTLTFTNTLASEPNEYHFLLKVNADKTTSESDYTNNNSNTEIKAYAPITDDLKITDSETAHRISWESVDGATSYEIRYSKEDGTEARAIVSGTTEYQLTEIPKEGTEIQLWAVESDNTKYEVKYTVPKADMIISALKMVSEPSVDQYYRVGDTIKYEVTMKNIGLGKAVAKDGKITIHLVAGKNNNTESMIQKAYAVSANGNDINNISSGDSVTVTMETVLSDSDLGETYFGGRADADGDIDEGNENNNYYIISTPVIVADYNQQKMDWVPIHYSESDELVKNGTVSVNDNYPFKIAATQSTIEYKVLNSSISDLDYSDIVTKYVGYANTHISIGFNNEYSIVSTKPYQYKKVGEGKGNYVQITDDNGNVTYKEVENNKGDYVVESFISDTVTQYSKVNGDYANNYGTSSFVPNFNVMQNQSCYINNWLNNGEVLAPTSKTQIDYVGNGFNFNAESWGLGKYYVMKLKTGPDENADWVEIAFRVKTDGSQWIKANATDGTDADKLPFYYHDDTYETNGIFFYDCSDTNLSSITSYNGNHLAVQLDNSTVPDLTKLNWRVAITTASVDDKGNFKIPTKLDEDYEVQIQSSTDGIVGVQGTGRLLMKLPEIMKQLPVHSDNGGTRDSNYYYMKIFYDTTDTSNPYVAIPIKVEADIPKIEEIHGMTVAKRGDNLSVQWTNTTTQDEHGYTYDIYIRDVKNNGEFVKVTDTPVVAGNYNFKDYDLQTIGNEYEVKVVGKWGGHCQSTEKTLSYKVVAPEKNRDYITDETFNYDSLSNDKWMPISGEHNLPVHLENTVSATVNADIYYYTDKDLDNVIGYNGSYISLVGNEKYFTGSTSSLYVKNGNTYKYESRNIYDNFYKGQILMNVAELFTTYGDYTDVSELYDRAMYYTVRVYGNNGANYKDYYFKIVPKPDGSTVEQSSGKWREISGEHKLPVTFSDLKLDGDVYFYDYKSKTNTYDIRGYNGEYMSLLGKKENYQAGTTTVQISKPISMNMASDFDRKTGTNSYDTDKYIEKAKAGTLHEIYGNATYTSDDSIFESKNIYESVYDGFINVKASDVVSVSYGTNFYILKITNGDNVTYVPMKVVVKSGDVEVQGFQINYDKGAGSASEFNPATRIVSRACKVMTVGDTLHRVKEHGTIFGVADYIKSSDMTLDSTSNYVSHMATTAKGLYNGYVSGLNDDDTYNYYGFTIKWNTYNYSALTTKYSYRAYAKLDNNQVVYGHKIYTANTYEVAENLYNNSKMPNIQAHDFLYDNILNIVDMGTNRKYISYAMVKALNVRTTTDPKYTLINTVFKDIYDYVRCSDESYTYKDRKPFKCKDANVESELLGYLNNASKKLHGSDFAEYKSLADWIYGETGNYGQSSMPSYPGCYKKTDFGWGSNIFTDYDSE